jgi:anion-transporting  ArsA/GET3 family ATPase
MSDPERAHAAVGGTTPEPVAPTGGRLATLLDRQQLIVCVGSGGVGKTTVAAALALQGALEGRRTMVLTIDPARRLADALGLAGLKTGGETIAPERLEAAGLHTRATLAAGMLDQTSAWDAFIARHSPSAEVRDTILANPFYLNLSRTFAGSTEYMAIEELSRIDEAGEYDLIVLDTPPSRHVLDFLEAPRRLEEFFDRSVLGWLARPASAGWSAWKTASRSARFVFERIEDATGVQALSEIASFFAAVETLVDGVTERSRTVRALLQAPTTSFVLVTGPDEQVLEDAEGLTASMKDLGVSLRGVVMNRLQDAGGVEDPGAFVLAAGLHRDGVEALERQRRAVEAAGVGTQVAAWLSDTLEARLLQSATQALRREVFEAALPAGVKLSAVTEQVRDVHDLASLARIARALTA